MAMYQHFAMWLAMMTRLDPDSAHDVKTQLLNLEGGDVPWNEADVEEFLTALSGTPGALSPRTYAGMIQQWKKIKEVLIYPDICPSAQQLAHISNCDVPAPPRATATARIP
ncbi:MAG TPA: hypothetical protein VN515_07950 [Terriglobales bacterium]|nr:hypothetical protein [Terriglobales bacterium]